MNVVPATTNSSSSAAYSNIYSASESNNNNSEETVTDDPVFNDYVSSNNNCPYSLKELNDIVLQSNANFTFDEDQILEEITSAELLTKVRGKGDSINWKAAHNYYMYRCRWALLADPSKKIFNKTRDQIKERFRRLKEKDIKKEQ